MAEETVRIVQEDTRSPRIKSTMTQAMLVPDVGGDDYELAATTETDRTSVWTRIEVRKARHGEWPQRIAEFTVAPGLFESWATTVIEEAAKVEDET